MANEWIKKLKKGMVLQFHDGTIDIVIATGYIKKENNQLKHYFLTKESLIINWKDIPTPKIIGYADTKDMKRINRITELIKRKK